MRTILVFIISCIITIPSFSQDIYIIDYDIILNTERPLKKTGKLIFDSQNGRSIFVESSPLKKSKIIKKESIESGNEIELNIAEDNPQFNFINFAKDTLISAEMMAFNIYNIAETLPKIKWEITDNEKKIGKHSVLLAKTFFRGRHYEAWFALDYPIRTGPWKLHGLPGLILEAYDESKRYMWVAKEIKSNQQSENFNGYFELTVNKNKTINIKTYAEKRYNNSISSMIQARLPREVKVEDRLINTRNGKEILFEWEIQD
ncbi:GLPGLI family protein [uncultured Maribacter sp.]|uniref:GLPGLI family protein n=1 Tax=uncultured Maribacter sp. TaxID=431308 RepID=UPI0030D8D680|tara:strand:- start:2937 stop:3716 length:780 start_codon:yes stop_codon:yes gene_type:complete